MLNQLFRNLYRSLKCWKKGHRIFPDGTTLYCTRCYKWSFDRGETWI